MPIMSNAGDSHDRSSIKICATSVVAMSDPMMTASAAYKGIVLFLAKEIKSKAVAVELCNNAVTVMPDEQAMKRLRVPLSMNFRTDVP